MSIKYLFLVISILCLQTSFAARFSKGYYYDKKRHRIDGLIDFNRGSFSVFGSKPGNIRSKKDEDAKPIKLTVDDITSFVIERDSFAIIYDFKINSLSGEYAKDFAQVITTGRITLLLHRSLSGDGRNMYENENYVLAKGYQILGVWNFKKQREEIANYFSGRTDLASKVMEGKDPKLLVSLVTDYNNGGTN